MSLTTADGIRGSVLRALAASRSAVLSMQALGNGLAAWLDLLIRFWLAKAFLLGVAMSMVMGTSPSMAFPSPIGPTLDALIASWLGMLIQTLCPVLLLAGLGSRFASILLLLQVSLLRGPDGLTPPLPFETILLGWIVVRGPGALSIDALLARGFVSTALPGAARLGRTFGWMQRRLGPWYQLALRLWIATAPLAAWPGNWSIIMRRGSLAPWLAGGPDTFTMVAPDLSVAFAVSLAVGFGTRATAVCLVALVPLAQAAMQLDDRLYWALALGILILRGPGSLSLDDLIDRILGRADHRLTHSDGAGLPHVVIVGGGFGGVAAARGLRRTVCRITLVDRRNYHLFQPLLYQVATAGLSPADIATPIRSLFRVQANVRVLLGEVDGIDAAARQIRVDGSPLAYDYLVLATGARHSYFGKDTWAASAPGLKTLEDATEIRRRLLTAFERAESATDPAERQAWTTFVIIGGGPTGVELAGAIAELARHGLDKEFRTIDPATARVLLVQSGPRLLPAFPDVLSADAADALRALGVEIWLGAKVDHVDREGIVLAGERLPARVVLWAAGVAASPAGAWLGVETDKAGRVLVGPDLSVPSQNRVFAVGDLAASAAWGGNPVPGLAPAAKQGGAHVAAVIRARLTGRPEPGPFRYRHAGNLATIGRRSAVAEFGLLKVHGALAWWLWGTAHVVFLAGGRNRMSVLLEWGWAYLTYRRGTRLITESQAATGKTT